MGPFRLHTAASNLAPGTLYFDHYSGKVFRIGAGARLEDVTAYVADPSPRRVDLSVHVDGKDVGRFWENGR